MCGRGGQGGHFGVYAVQSGITLKASDNSRVSQVSLHLRSSGLDYYSPTLIAKETLPGPARNLMIARRAGAKGPDAASSTVAPTTRD